MLNAAGQVSTKTAVSSVRINNFVDFTDFVRLTIEVTMLVLMFKHTFKEIKTARSVGVVTYLNFWNSIDTARQLLFYSCAISYVILMLDPMRMHPEKVENMCNGGGWINFPKLAKMEEDYVFNSSLCLLVSTLLIFKFLTPFPKVWPDVPLIWQFNVLITSCVSVTVWHLCAHYGCCWKRPSKFYVHLVDLTLRVRDYWSPSLWPCNGRILHCFGLFSVGCPQRYWSV
jgi:hypothetical protein